MTDGSLLSTHAASGPGPFSVGVCRVSRGVWIIEPHELVARLEHSERIAQLRCLGGGAHIRVDGRG
jgi:hypothetical protein